MGKVASWRRGAGAKAIWPAIAVLLIGLAACSPVETYRHLTGASKDDPNPQTTPNTKNLEAGEASGYPNLATVPPPPSRALSAAEREKLTQSLIADRTNAKYTSEKLQAGFAAASAPPPPPPPPAAAANEPAAAPMAVQVSPTAAAAPAPTVSAGIASSSGAVAGAPPPLGSAAGTTAAAPAAAKGPRKAGEPPEPGPMESSLQSPQISSLPNPQQSQPPPAPPRDLRLPAAPTAANAVLGAAHLPMPPAAAPMPAAIASAKFQPPPPPPVLPPVAPAPSAAAAGPGKSAAKPHVPRVDTQIAEIRFPAGATTLSAADRRTVDNIVPLYLQNPGKVRVIGYTGVGSSAVDQLNGYRAALDRAQAVAAALTQAGIPADKVVAEAAPAGTDSGQSRAEILFEH